MVTEASETHSDTRTEMNATSAGAFLCDESDRGLVRMDGRDARDLLHRLSSASIVDLKEGQLRETLLTTEKGRVIDALLAARTADALKLLTSAGRSAAVIAWLEKFTIMEDCTYADLSSGHAQFSIYNLTAEWESHFSGVAIPAPDMFHSVTLGGIDADLLHHRSVTGAGLRLVCRAEDAERLWLHLTQERGLPAVGRHAFTLWRIARLLPASGHELSDRGNPLEAGAEAAVDLRKGCFIGQEVIARLDSYDKVQRHPRRLLFGYDRPTDIPVGTQLECEGADAGFVTTAAFDPARGRMVGIGLLRPAFEAEGTKLRCGGTEAEVLT